MGLSAQGFSFGPVDMTSSNTLLFLVLCVIGESLSDLPKCNPDHRDCSCADKSYLGCDEPESFDKLHVSNLQECIMSCDVSQVSHLKICLNPKDLCRIIQYGFYTF